MGVTILGKIKLYEIAKKLGLASKEVVEMAGKLNIEVKNHMSAVSEEEAEKIEKRFNNKGQSNSEEKANINEGKDKNKSNKPEVNKNSKKED